MDKLQPTPILGGYDTTNSGIRIWERSELALVSLSVPLGGEADATKALKKAYKLDFPASGTSVATKTHRAIRVGVDQAMLVFSDVAALAEPNVQASLAGAFYTTNQTDAWVVLTIEGENVRAVLERLCPLDLDASVFPIDQVQRTVMEHMSAIILREDENRFTLMSASSAAQSFLHALETSIQYTT